MDEKDQNGRINKLDQLRKELLPATLNLRSNDSKFLNKKRKSIDLKGDQNMAITNFMGNCLKAEPNYNSFITNINNQAKLLTPKTNVDPLHGSNSIKRYFKPREVSINGMNENSKHILGKEDNPVQSLAQEDLNLNSKDCSNNLSSLLPRFVNNNNNTNLSYNFFSNFPDTSNKVPSYLQTPTRYVDYSFYLGINRKDDDPLHGINERQEENTETIFPKTELTFAFDESAEKSFNIFVNKSKSENHQMTPAKPSPFQSQINIKSSLMKNRKLDDDQLKKNSLTQFNLIDSIKNRAEPHSTQSKMNHQLQITSFYCNNKIVSQSAWCKLPYHIMADVLKYLAFKDTCKMEQVCKDFKAFAREAYHSYSWLSEMASSKIRSDKEFSFLLQKTRSLDHSKLINTIIKREFGDSIRNFMSRSNFVLKISDLKHLNTLNKELESIEVRDQARFNGYDPRQGILLESFKIKKTNRDNFISITSIISICISSKYTLIELMVKGCIKVGNRISESIGDCVFLQKLDISDNP